MGNRCCEFNKLSHKLIDEVGHCELCGSRRNLEVHHIIPRCVETFGIDLDNENNLIVVCSCCHAKLTPKKLLTSYGIAKAKAEGTDAKLIQFYNLVSDLDIYDAIDVVDLVEYVFSKTISKERRDELSAKLGIEVLDGSN